MNIDQRVLPCFSGPPDLVAPLMLLHIWIRDRGLSRWLSVATMTIDHSMEIRIVDRPTYLLYYCSIDASRSSGCGQASSKRGYFTASSSLCDLASVFLQAPSSGVLLLTRDWGSEMEMSYVFWMCPLASFAEVLLPPTEKENHILCPNQEGDQ